MVAALVCADAALARHAAVGLMSGGDCGCCCCGFCFEYCCLGEFSDGDRCKSDGAAATGEKKVDDTGEARRAVCAACIAAGVRRTEFNRCCCCEPEACDTGRVGVAHSPAPRCSAAVAAARCRSNSAGGSSGDDVRLSRRGDEADANMARAGEADGDRWDDDTFDMRTRACARAPASAWSANSCGGSAREDDEDCSFIAAAVEVCSEGSDMEVDMDWAAAAEADAEEEANCVRGAAESRTDEAVDWSDDDENDEVDDTVEATELLSSSSLSTLQLSSRRFPS